MRIAGKQNWIAQLPTQVRSELYAHMKTVNYEAGDVIVRSGSPALGIHQVQSGYVKILKDLPSGDQVLLALYIPGNVFSESAVIAGRDHHHTTIAATPVTLKVLDKKDFDELFQLHHQIPELLCQKLAGAMSQVLKNREMTSLHNVHTRVALLFYNLHKYCSAPSGIIIEVPLTVSDLADFLGVTRQTVQKEVSALKAAGALQKTDSRWEILDAKQLQRLAHIGSVPR